MNSKLAPGSKKTTTTTTVTAPRGAASKGKAKQSSQRPSPVPGPKMAYQSVMDARPRRLHRVVSSLVGSITLPKEIEPIRIGSAYGSDKTAVARLFRKTNIVPAGSGASPSVPKSQQIAFAFRDPLRSFIYTYGLNPDDEYKYWSVGASIPAQQLANVQIQFAGPLQLTNPSNCSPHGTVMYPGRLSPSDPHRGFLVNYGDKVTLQIEARPAVTTGTYVISLMKLEGTMWSEAPIPYSSFNQQSGGTVEYFPNETGYYSWNVYVARNNDQPTVDVQCLVAITHSPNSLNASSIFAQLPLPGIDQHLESIEGYRIPAVSLMLTNTASPLNRQGQVVGLQCPKRTHWYDFTEYEDITSNSKSTTLNIVNGMYGFLKPTSASDLDTDVCVYANNETENDVVYDLLPKSDYLTIQADITLADGRQGYFTPCHHIEFTTLSQWFEQRDQGVDPNDLESALRIVGKMPQWHENDLHFSDIWNGIKSFASDIWSGVKEVGSTLAPLAPLLPLLLA